MRGLAGEFPLEATSLYAAGKALAQHFAASKDRRNHAAPQFIIGRDTRESGTSLEQAFTRGATEAAAICQSCGVLPTPGVAYLTAYHRADAGIVLSASHNPFTDNGVKIFTRSGRKLDESVERQLETAIYAAQATNSNDGKTPDAAANASESAIQINDSLFQDYKNYLLQIAGDLRLEGWRIVADCAHGAAYKIAPEVLRELGAEVTVINAAPDGRNINERCGSLHLEALQQAVKDSRADFGVAFDGDADRSLFVDEQGEIVDGDATLWILGCAMKKRGELTGDTVVATVMSNLGLEQAFAQQYGIRMLRAAVGDKYVLERLQQTGSKLGGEQSGHIIFPAESLVGDGLRTTLHVLRVCVNSKAKLSQLASGFARLPQILVNVRVREKLAFDDVAAIKSAANAIENQLGTSGRLLLRYSGTEPLARVMIEGTDYKSIAAAAHHLAGVIKNEIG